MRYLAAFGVFTSGTALAAALTLPAKVNAYTLNERDATWPNVGNYNFVACSDDENNSLITVLPALLKALQSGLKDAQTSRSHPSGAYEIFFKDPKNAQFVADVIQNITTGIPIYPPASNTNGSPTFICPKKGNMEVRMKDGTGGETVGDAYTQCIESDPPLAARYLGPTPWIILCPTFFEQPQFPPPGSESCPAIDRGTNRFARKQGIDKMTAGSSVWQNQMWILFHEIVHYYHRAQPDNVRIPEAYNINEAWALSATDSIWNSENLVYYAATIEAKCRAWPALSRDNERELNALGPDDAEVIDEGSDAASGDAITVSEAEYSDAAGNEVNF
ncbi:MAG: hypothetical protein Q9168_003268 [Polycauliona sp. 1 TL-2023]